MKSTARSFVQGPLGFLLLLVSAVIVIRSLAGGGTPAPTPEAFADNLTLQQAMDRSASSGKPVFAFATADWCGPCQAFKRGALSDPEVIETLRADSLPVYIDVDRDQEARVRVAQLAGEQDVRSIPALFLIKDGRVVSHRVGGMSSSALIEWLRQAQSG